MHLAAVVALMKRAALGLVSGLGVFGAIAALAPGRASAQDGAWSTPTPTSFNTPPPDVPLTPPHGYAANRGPQLGARFGYAAGFGVVYSGLTVQDGSHGALPIIVDVGWRFLPQLYVGLYGQYAPVLTRNNANWCPDGYDCSAQDWRFGAQADWHFVPRSRFDPYLGIGAGYEILHTTVNGTMTVPTPLGAAQGTASAGIIDRGWELAALTLGFDARVDRYFGIGPFVTVSLNEYNVHTGTQSLTVAGTQVVNGPVAQVSHGMHEFLMAGVRGTLNP